MVGLWTVWRGVSGPSGGGLRTVWWWGLRTGLEELQTGLEVLRSVPTFLEDLQGFKEDLQAVRGDPGLGGLPLVCVFIV